MAMVFCPGSDVSSDTLNMRWTDRKSTVSILPVKRRKIFICSLAEIVVTCTYSFLTDCEGFFRSVDSVRGVYCGKARNDTFSGVGFLGL